MTMMTPVEKKTPTTTETTLTRSAVGKRKQTHVLHTCSQICYTYMMAEE